MTKMEALTRGGWWYGTTDNKNVAYYTKTPPKMHATITECENGNAVGVIYGIKESGCHGKIETIHGDFDSVVKEIEGWCKAYFRIEVLINESEYTICNTPDEER